MSYWKEFQMEQEVQKYEKIMSKVKALKSVLDCDIDDEDCVGLGEVSDFNNHPCKYYPCGCDYSERICNIMEREAVRNSHTYKRLQQVVL